MDLKDLNCPQFVNFNSEEFLCTEFSSVSINATEWTPAKKAKEISLKDEKIECEKKLDTLLNKKEFSDDKENKQSKTNKKNSEQPPTSVVGIKRKHTELCKPFVREITNLKNGFEGPSSFQPKNFLPLKTSRLPIKSPQLSLPAVKRRRLESVLEDKQKLTHKALHPKTSIHKGQDPLLNHKTTISKNIHFKNVKFPLQNHNPSEKINPKTHPVSLKEPSSQRSKEEVKNELKTQKLLLNKPSSTTAKKCTEIQPFSFDRLDKERLLKKEKKIKDELETEKKVFVFSAGSNLNVVSTTKPCISKKIPTKPEPFRFGLNKCPQKDIAENCPAFKARPATVLKSKPFVPKPSRKGGIEVHEFKLHTQQRAVERHLKQQAEIENLERGRLNFLEKLKKDRAEILRRRREIFERYHIKIKPLENKQSSVAETDSTNDKKKRK